MTWKNSIDDIKVICKKCGMIMVVESSLNNTNSIYVCNKCGEHINLKIR